MSSLNGYDKQNSFLIPVENTKQTFLVAVPGWTLKNTDTQLLGDLGLV